jgi:hypothetical protein
MQHECTDAGGRAPTVGALGDAGAVAEGLDWLGGMNWLGKWQMTGIHSGQRGQLRQDFGMIRLESSGSDCSMGMRFRGKGVNPSYTLLRQLEK